MHFQLILDQHAVAQYPQILLGVAGSELGGKNVGGGLAQQRRNGFETAAPGQRQVGQQVAGLGVFDKEHHVGDRVQQRRDQRQRIQQIAQVVRALLRQAVAQARKMFDGENVLLLRQPHERRRREKPEADSLKWIA